MIRHVLLDADGVLQRHPLGWVAAAERFVGDRASEFFAAVSEVERTCLRGDGEFFPLLAAELERFAVTAPADEVYAGVWLTIESVPATVELVHALRDAGYAVHLGTNQQAGRAAYMRAELGYDDACCASPCRRSPRPARDNQSGRRSRCRGRVERPGRASGQRHAVPARRSRSRSTPSSRCQCSAASPHSRAASTFASASSTKSTSGAGAPSRSRTRREERRVGLGHAELAGVEGLVEEVVVAELVAHVRRPAGLLVGGRGARRPRVAQGVDELDGGRHGLDREPDVGVDLRGRHRHPHRSSCAASSGRKSAVSAQAGPLQHRDRAEEVGGPVAHEALGRRRPSRRGAAAAPRRRPAGRAGSSGGSVGAVPPDERRGSRSASSGRQTIRSGSETSSWL